MFTQRKRSIPFLLAFFGLLSTAIIGRAQELEGARYEFNLPPTQIETGQRIILPGSSAGSPFSSYAFLVFDVEHQNPASSILLLSFSRSGDSKMDNGYYPSRLKARIGILPGLPTQIIFPLHYLDGEKIFLPRFPRQLKGTVDGKRLESTLIQEVYLQLQTHRGFNYPENITVKNIRLVNTLPPDLVPEEQSWVDSLGQWALKEWPGKVKGLNHLDKAFSKSVLHAQKRARKLSRSNYQGYLDLRFDSTGFFHVHHDSTRWWFVDPEGYAYLSFGPTGVGFGASGPIEGQEDLFTYLPDSKEYEGLYSRVRGLRHISYVTLNLMRVLGSDWKNEWINTTRDLLLGMGFTGSGNWSSSEFHEKGKMPYVLPMRGFPSTPTKLFRDFPDVFDPAFVISAEKFANQLVEKKNDPWMLGYFLGNEPHWAFGEYVLARELLYKNQESFTRKNLVAWLTEKYMHNPYVFSAAWGLQLSSFSELESMIIPHEKYLSSKAMVDLKEYSKKMIDRYAGVICEATKKADPNHLNLGIRYAWISSEACIQTGKFFDVFSLNGYSFPNPPETGKLALRLNKPILIGEFHFGSTDRGLPATGIKGVASQKDRGIAYRYYMENGFARPEIIGMHYFQWHDQPVTGRFDGENYNIGMVDVTYRPYEEFAKGILKTNKILYRVAAGKKKAYGRKAKAMPSIYY